jgi:hypothetical protein
MGSVAPSIRPPAQTLVKRLAARRSVSGKWKNHLHSSPLAPDPSATQWTRPGRDGPPWRSSTRLPSPKAWRWLRSDLIGKGRQCRAGHGGCQILDRRGPKSPNTPSRVSWQFHCRTFIVLSWWLLHVPCQLTKSNLTAATRLPIAVRAVKRASASATKAIRLTRAIRYALARPASHPDWDTETRAGTAGPGRAEARIQ